MSRMWMQKSVLSDSALIVLVFLATLLESAQPLDPSAALDFTAGGWIVLNAICAATVPLRRRAPILVLAGLGIAGCLLITVGRPPLIAPIVIIVYAVAVYTSVRIATLGAVILVIAFFCLEVVTGQLTSNNVNAPVALAIALLLGLSAGNRRKYLAAVVDRADQRNQDHDQRARLATANERTRIARELHDVIAHSLSVMIRLSDGAAAVVSTDPTQANETIRKVSEVGRNSLQDMRRLLGVLQDDASISLTPTPRLDDLDDLVEVYRSAGLPVQLETHGTFPIGNAVQLVIYRVVQETLTNALRYADAPSLVSVVITGGDGGVTIDVTDDGRSGWGAGSEGTQRGLIGLRERAALYGGTLQVGPRNGDEAQGWAVRLTLPQANEQS